MIAPTAEQILNNIRSLDEVRICMFTDFDRSNQRIAEFECFKVKYNPELWGSALINLTAYIKNTFGSICDTDGVTLCSLTTSIVVKEMGYILYLKYNDLTKCLDIYSVNDDFLEFMTQQHSWYIKNPSVLTVPFMDIVDLDQYVFDLDVKHQFSPSVRRTETSLDTRLSAFDTSVLGGVCNLSDDLLHIPGISKDIPITVTELSSEHVFNAVWFKDNVLPNRSIKANNNSLLLVGHAGIGLVYNFTDKKTYIVNKILTKIR